jgi:hypothetical protein
MNWFVFISALLYLGGLAVEIHKGNYQLATVFAAYALANFALCR